MMPTESFLLVDLVLYRQTVAIPAPFADNLLSRLMLVSAHDILDGTRQDMAVVRKTRRERRSIVEDEWGTIFFDIFGLIGVGTC